MERGEKPHLLTIISGLFNGGSFFLFFLCEQVIARTKFLIHYLFQSFTSLQIPSTSTASFFLALLHTTVGVRWRVSESKALRKVTEMKALHVENMLEISGICGVGPYRCLEGSLGSCVQGFALQYESLQRKL